LKINSEFLKVYLTAWRNIISTILPQKPDIPLSKGDSRISASNVCGVPQQTRLQGDSLLGLY
jgi:hypothetical protein